MPIKPTTRSEATAIKNRLIRCMPASRFEMATLCRLAGIETTRLVPTAAVECKRSPRLLINPDFVEKYCQRDEHLFLLVMHELWHVLLAHTRMHPRMTPVQNVAFDAIINAGIMAQFPQPEYRGFFDALNPADQFPHCLLRPPEGWPQEPIYPDNLPPGTKELLMRLYPKSRPRLSMPRLPMYEEVLALLLKSGVKWKVEPMLLGNHGDEVIHDPLMKEVMDEVTRDWTYVPGKPATGGTNRRGRFEMSSTTEDVRRAFATILHQALSRRPGQQRHISKLLTPTIGGNGVIPNGRDRLIHARRMLGASEMLWAQPSQVRARMPDRPSRAIVYLDVSGSMNYMMSHCLYLLNPYIQRKQAEGFQFSTMVNPINPDDFRQGQIMGTGGTDINCVFEHLLKIYPKADRVLIVTDGVVGTPRIDLVNGMAEYGAKLYVVLPHNGNLDPTVREMAKSVVMLPALAG